jgi:Mrp family chromosome partitioning ATPase
VFSGLSHGCGTTQVAINVAHALMSFRPSVVLLEANLRRPGMADALGIPAVPGLETALRGERPWSELTRSDATRGIRVLPAEGGERPVSVAGLAQILMDVKERDTTLIVDADSVLDDDISYYIAAHADAVVFVARQDASLYRQLRFSIDRMTLSGVPAMTAVLNDNRSISLTRVFDRVQDALLVVTRVHQSLRRRLRLIRIRAKRRKD